MPPKATTGDRIRVIAPQDRDLGKTGVVVSGKSETTLYRVLMDDFNKSTSHSAHRYFLPCEFEVVSKPS
jgi:hypothetical protein